MGRQLDITNNIGDSRESNMPPDASLSIPANEMLIPTDEHISETG
jgi:hypothetical protein